VQGMGMGSCAGAHRGVLSFGHFFRRGGLLYERELCNLPSYLHCTRVSVSKKVSKHRQPAAYTWRGGHPQAY